MTTAKYNHPSYAEIYVKSGETLDHTKVSLALPANVGRAPSQQKKGCGLLLRRTPSSEVRLVTAQ